MSLEDFREQNEIHAVGGFVFLRAALCTMSRQSAKILGSACHPAKGSIVLLTSLASEGAYIGVGNYIAAKCGVKGLVQTAGRSNHPF